MDLQTWSAGLAELHQRIAGRFARSEPRERVLAYIRGLLAGLERKNGWTLAEFAGQISPDGMQRLVRTADWDADAVRDDLRDYAMDHLADRDGVLIIDDTGFLKKGVRSAGVQRQYSGTAGRTENCQIGVFLAYASSRGRALIDRELYLPASWTDDRARCRQAGIDDHVRFATKHQLAKAMLTRALQAEVPFTWFTADEAYGQAKSLRVWLEQRDVFHVPATRRDDTVVSMQLQQRRVDDLVASLPAQAWRRRSCGDGAHGQRLYAWARVPIRPLRVAGRGHWVLARRSLTNSDDIACYVCYGPARTSLDQLLRVAGSRWAIEECFQAAKNEAGMDHYQVRSYTGWYRHITLSMLAHAFLAVTATQANGIGPAPTPHQKIMISSP
ncbi:IS701 family transposase [Streptosporangium pseudovulgare]|nr:IS701 family transposase [Streptosporangium pseudovulgare]